MFFRTRGNSVQVLRSEKNSEGRNIQVSLGSMNLLTGKENLDPDKPLKPDERKKIKEWKNKQSEIAKLEKTLSALKISSQMQSTANDISAGRVSMSEADLNEIEFAWRQLRFAVNRSLKSS